MDEKGEGGLRGVSTRCWAKDGGSHGGEQETRYFCGLQGRVCWGRVEEQLL